MGIREIRVFGSAVATPNESSQKEKKKTVIIS